MENNVSVQGAWCNQVWNKVSSYVTKWFTVQVLASLVCFMLEVASYIILEKAANRHQNYRKLMMVSLFLGIGSAFIFFLALAYMTYKGPSLKCGLGCICIPWCFYKNPRKRWGTFIELVGLFGLMAQIVLTFMFFLDGSAKLPMCLQVLPLFAASGQFLFVLCVLHGEKVVMFCRNRRFTELKGFPYGPNWAVKCPEDIDVDKTCRASPLQEIIVDEYYNIRSPRVVIQPNDPVQRDPPAPAQLDPPAPAQLDPPPAPAQLDPPPAPAQLDPPPAPAQLDPPTAPGQLDPPPAPGQLDPPPAPGPQDPPAPGPQDPPPAPGL